MMKISVVVVLALMLPGLLGYALAAPVITTSPVAFVTDGADGFEELEGPKGITAVTIGSSTYALAASYRDNGVQIMNITDPFNPVPIAAVTDGADGFEELEGARDITTVTIGSSTYAIVTASADHGIQIINITDPSNPTPASHISSIPGIHFNDPREVTTVTIGSSTYALVAASGSGVHIIDITDPSSPVSVAYVSDAGTGFDALGNSRGITTTTIGSSTYAIVAAFEGAVQIMDITDPSAPTPVGSVHDSQDTMLRGAIAVTTFTSGSSMYALVAAQTDDAVQILNITDLSNPDPVAFVKHGVAGFDALQYPETIATVTFGSSTYALVAAFIDGIQIIDVTNPSSPTPAASVHSFDARFDGFPLPEDMVVTEVGSRTYALVASNMGNGIQIIDVDLTYGPVLTSAALNEETGILEITFMDTVDTTPASTVDLSGLTIHDSGQSVSLAGATLRTEADSAVISIELTEIQSRSVAAMASPRLDISSSAVADTLGNPIELSLGSTITVNDDVAPEIVSVIMDTVTGILEITFSDRIDVTPAFMVYTGGMTLRDSGQSVSLAGATLRTEADSAVISIELTEGQRQSITTPVSSLLDVIYYGVADTDGNPIEASSDNAVTVKNTNEAEPPAFRSADYTAGDSQLAITFSKPLNGTIHLDRLHVRDAGQSSGGVTMTGAAGRSVSGDTLTITLVASQVATIGSLTTPQLDVDRGAVFDLAGIGITDTPDQPVILINTPPTVDAGQDQTVNEDTQVTLSGTTTDADGDLLTYLWSHDQATGIIINNSTSLLTTFTAPQVSSNTTFTFTLTASDGNATGSDTVSITVLDIPIDDQPVILINTPPTVDAGQDQTVNEDTQVTLSGTTTDADGDLLTYLWSHNSTTLDIALANATSASTTFTAPRVDSDTAIAFTLTANDDTATSSDSVIITVTAHVNSLPSVKAGPAQTVKGGSEVSLNGTATDHDKDVMTYLWTHNYTSSDITLANATSASTTFTAPRVDSDTAIAFTLTANDDTATSSDSVIITVTAHVNSLPSVKAGPAQTVKGGSEVSLNGTATDHDKDVMTYLWTHNYTSSDITLANATSASTTFTAPRVDSDTAIAFTLTANDDTATSSDSVIITVTAHVNSLPSVKAGPAQTVKGGSEVSLNGTATDHDKDVMTYLWTHNYTSSDITLANATSASTTFTAPRVDSDTAITFTLTANDDTATSSDSVIITVTAHVNSLPSVKAGPAQTVKGGSEVSLNGTATDHDKDVMTYLWTHNYTSSDITLANATSASTTFTAPRVDSDTAITFTLTANDDTATSSDSVIITVTAHVNLTLAVTSIPAGTTPEAAFVTTWQTTSANEFILIPVGESTGTYTVNWGDASIDTDVSGHQMHTYKNAGTYTVSIYGDFSQIYLPYYIESALKLQSIEQWGDIRWESMRSAFSGATNMVYRATDAPDLSDVTDTSEMFMFATSFNGNLSTWDVSHVTDMRGMFDIATAFNGDISSWNVSGVTDMSNMFLAAWAFTQNLGDWYIVLDETTISDANTMLAISAQNAYLDGQNPVYTIDLIAPGGDKFRIVNGSHLATRTDQTVAPGQYNVTIKSTGSFGTDNSKIVGITVSEDVILQTNSPPSVKAGPAQTVQEGSKVSLNGTATDSDEDVMTYLWTHNSTSSDITLANATSASTTFTAPRVDSDTAITFTLTANDDTATSSDSVIITVTAHVNSPPSVKAGPAQTVQEGSKVSLNGTATDPDEDVMTYLWTHNSTSSDITLANATSASTTFTAPRVDSDTAITFTLTANDDTATSSDSVIITVTAHVNSPPSVKAGPAQTVQEGSEVSLNGTATDPDKDVMTYLWSHDQATGIIINNSTSLLTTFTAPQVSSNTTFTFTLTASDGNAAGSDTVSITVLDVPADDQLNSTNTPMSNTVVLEPDEAYGPRDIGQVTLSGVTPGVIDASWEAPSEAPADYRIRWAKTDESYKTWTDFSGNAFPAVTSQTITDLEEGETYKVIVRARYGGTSGDWSGNVIITVAETTITVAETVANTPATGSPVISGTIQVRQTLTADASGIADVDGMTNATLSYQWVSSDGVTDTDIAEATISRYVLTAGDQGMVIKVRVTFTDDAGYAESLTSNATVAVTSASTVPGVPTGLSVLPVDSGALNVSWQTPISDGGSAITGYTIQWKAAPDSWTVPADVSEATATGITHTITGLTDGTPYTVRVIATNQIGNGEPTTESTVTSMTPQQLGPRDIGRVTLSSTTPGIIDASWEAPGEAPVDYRVSWAKVGESYLTWTDLTGNAFPTATSQTIADLEEGETYKVTVRARYGGTSGDWSADAIIIIITTAGS